jgi:hypothetical protein
MVLLANSQQVLLVLDGALEIGLDINALGRFSTAACGGGVGGLADGRLNPLGWSPWCPRRDADARGDLPLSQHRRDAHHGEA